MQTYLQYCNTDRKKFVCTFKKFSTSEYFISCFSLLPIIASGVTKLRWSIDQTHSQRKNHKTIRKPTSKRKTRKLEGESFCELAKIKREETSNYTGKVLATTLSFCILTNYVIEIDGVGRICCIRVHFAVLVKRGKQIRSSLFIISCLGMLSLHAR